MLGDLGASTLRSIKTMTQFSSPFEHQTSHAVFFNARTTLRVHLRGPLIFLVISTCWETHFSSRRYSTYFFFHFFFGSSYQTSRPPRCSDTTLWVHLRCPLNFFIIISIYWKPASYRLSLDLSSFGMATNRSAAKLNLLFFLLDWRAYYSTCR
jgi:hypothetical protein